MNEREKQNAYTISPPVGITSPKKKLVFKPVPPYDPDMAYYGDISREETEQLLKPQPHGTYLTR